ncbi:hypothetical protein [Roseicella aquatilis]|uniref:Uncharacterized protein n=1 Tax=Roseicella aquatilis TaxID=2527868 RepID=A0A4R4DDH5_9PROT|nr:hypothetical protein [Roseicella aquatilis]TCZ57897.1 hypothetical protein EXY23_17055 [Roseicella aquatilis]
MPRLSLAAIIPPLILLTVIVLFVHRWTGAPEPVAPPPTTAALREAEGQAGGAGRPIQPGSANSALPPGEMNPVPAGTRAVEPPGNPPSSAMPTAPSGEPARAPAGG